MLDAGGRGSYSLAEKATPVGSRWSDSARCCAGHAIIVVSLKQLKLYNNVRRDKVRAGAKKVTDTAGQIDLNTVPSVWLPMMDRADPSRRPRQHFAAVADTLRRGITAGRWPPGSQLPTKLELCRLLGASGGTIQRALRILTAEGFLSAHGRLGTRVRSDSPHVHRVALVLNGRADSSLGYAALVRAAQAGDSNRGVSVSVYEGCYCDPVVGGAFSEGLRVLDEDVALHRLKGAILASAPAGLGNSQTRRRKGLPRVWLGSHVSANQEPVITLQPALPRALGVFAAKGRKRLAYFGTFHLAEVVGHVAQEAQAMGLSCEALHTHLLHEHYPQPARGIARLLMALPRSRRPDAIFIADDHVAEHVMAGLADAEVSAGKHVDVIMMANFPRTASALSLARQDPRVITLGYDARTVLATALRTLASIAEPAPPGRKLPIPYLSEIAATFDHELPAGAEEA